MYSPEQQNYFAPSPALCRAVNSVFGLYDTLDLPPEVRPNPMVRAIASQLIALYVGDTDGNDRVDMVFGKIPPPNFYPNTLSAIDGTVYGLVGVEGPPNLVELLEVAPNCNFLWDMGPAKDHYSANGIECSDSLPNV